MLPVSRDPGPRLNTERPKRSSSNTRDDLQVHAHAATRHAHRAAHTDVLQRTKRGDRDTIMRIIRNRAIKGSVMHTKRTHTILTSATIRIIARTIKQHTRDKTSVTRSPLNPNTDAIHTLGTIRTVAQRGLRIVGNAAKSGRLTHLAQRSVCLRDTHFGPNRGPRLGAVGPPTCIDVCLRDGQHGPKGGPHQAVTCRHVAARSSGVIIHRARGTSRSRTGHAQ